MKDYKKMFNQELKDEFVHTAFMADLKVKIPRYLLHDMFVRADLGIVWDVVSSCIEHKRGDIDESD